MYRALILIIIALALVACGGSGAPAATSTPAATATTSPTSTPQPSSTPAATATVAASATPPKVTATAPAAAPKPGLGISRALIQSKFEGSPLFVKFTDGEPRDGVPQVVGASKMRDLEVWLVGPADNIVEVQVVGTLEDQATIEEFLRLTVAAIEVTTPSIDDPTTWLQPHMSKALDEGTDVALEEGRMFSIITAKEIKYIVFSILPGV